VVAVFVMGFCLMAALLSMSTFMPLFLQVSTGVSATRSGLMLTPQSIGISFMATVGGYLVSRTGRYKWTMLIGGALAALSLLLLTRIGPETGALDLAPTLFVLGLGLGLIFPNLTLSVQNAVGIEDLGIGTSTANFFRSMGGAFGAAIAGALLTHRLNRELMSELGASRLADLGGAEGLVRTPKVVHDLPEELRRAVIEAVSHSVVAVIWWAVPLLVFVWLVALTVKELPLRTSSALGGAGAPDDSSPPQVATPSQEPSSNRSGVVAARAVVTGRRLSDGGRRPARRRRRAPD
jgi:MFS family permease